MVVFDVTYPLCLPSCVAPAPAAAAFVPRSVARKAPDGGPEQPRSNDEFRKMLLAKKPEAEK